ncbi:hypothetical protein [Sporomusa sp. KB1]|jgi:hypothetical protein|uniref:hypothetical protein n=1 Tax=Sporomusa sp. KB1 TaxID=943346 RepID=UPI0011A6F919|nr:hypothetical protein [Sporomusa sp. KB1]TWH49633.1 hypothetical protein Salpa_5872 [Sporomusa sp. KB1]
MKQNLKDNELLFIDMGRDTGEITACGNIEDLSETELIEIEKAYKEIQDGNGIEWKMGMI